MDDRLPWVAVERDGYARTTLPALVTPSSCIDSCSSCAARTRSVAAPPTPRPTIPCVVGRRDPYPAGRARTRRSLFGVFGTYEDETGLVRVPAGRGTSIQPRDGVASDEQIVGSFDLLYPRLGNQRLRVGRGLATDGVIGMGPGPHRLTRRHCGDAPARPRPTARIVEAENNLHCTIIQGRQYLRSARVLPPSKAPPAGSAT